MDNKLIEKALKYAVLAHNKQVRKVTKESYVTHPIFVSILVKYFLNKQSIFKNKTDLIIVAILHDVLEDTNATYQNLAKNFGNYIANLVLDLSNDEILVQSLGKLEYLKNKMLQMEKESFFIKLVDRLHNIMDKPKTIYVLDTLELIQFLKLIMGNELNKLDKMVMYKIEQQCKEHILSIS